MSGTIPTGTSPLTRLVFVDLARAVAILMMIQGHTLNVLLDPSLRENLVFDLWHFVRGLTSPLFLLLAGFSFTVATSRRWELFLDVSHRFWQRIGKFLFFLLLGYLMHFPVHHARDLRFLDEAGWRGFLQVDILQSIAVTLIALQLLVLLLRTRERFGWVTLFLSLAVILLTPVVWVVDWTRSLPLSLAAYLSSDTGSLFPLFPWAAYTLLGAFLGNAYVSWNAKRPAWFPRQAFLGGGLLLVLIGVVLASLGWSPYSRVEFWKTSPNLFLIRAGSVLILLGLLFHISQYLRRLPQAFGALSQESFTIYFVHVCILYGSIWNDGLWQRIGPRLGLVPTLSGIAALVISMALLALGWNWFKKHQRRGTYLARAAIAFALAYSLL